jgi:hypothetical protein
MSVSYETYSTAQFIPWQIENLKQNLNEHVLTSRTQLTTRGVISLSLSFFICELRIKVVLTIQVLVRILKQYLLSSIEHCRNVIKISCNIMKTLLQIDLRNQCTPPSIWDSPALVSECHPDKTPMMALFCHWDIWWLTISLTWTWRWPPPLDKVLSTDPSLSLDIGLRPFPASLFLHQVRNCPLDS